MRATLAIVVLAACTTNSGSVATRSCPMGHEDKFQFSYATTCANDGSVQFCVPDGDPSVMARLAAVSSMIRCMPAAGASSAGCVSGQQLCFYDTAYPTQCSGFDGPATSATWADLCTIAMFPEVVAIVPTTLQI